MNHAPKKKKEKEEKNNHNCPYLEQLRMKRVSYLKKKKRISIANNYYHKNILYIYITHKLKI